MAVDYEYAYNYWRKVFVDASDGHFRNRDFDQWFRHYPFAVANPRPGSKEHFDQLALTAFNQMLEACAAGRFSK